MGKHRKAGNFKPGDKVEGVIYRKSGDVGTGVFGIVLRRAADSPSNGYHPMYTVEWDTPYGPSVRSMAQGNMRKVAK